MKSTRFMGFKGVLKVFKKACLLRLIASRMNAIPNIPNVVIAVAARLFTTYALRCNS